MKSLRWMIPALALLALACAPAAQAQKAQPRIIAGSDVSISTYPFQVSLRRNGNFSCGGSIRDATHIITAAHCVTNALKQPIAAANFTVGYGSDSLSSQAIRGVTSLSVPPEYQPPTLDSSYDVAVLTLGTAIDLSGPNAKSIPLVNPTQPEDVGTGLVSGWGDTTYGGSISQTLRGTRVPLRADSACASYYGSSYVSSRTVCAGGGSLPGGTNPDTCQGDSGGPLVVDLDDTSGINFALLGITSFGDGCGQQDVPAAYTDTQGAGIAAFLEAPSYQTATVTSGNVETGTPGARAAAAPASPPSTAPPVSQAPPPSAPVAATRDTIRPTARVSKLSCTKKRRCSFRVRASDSGGRVTKLSATVSRKVKICEQRGDFRVCNTKTLKRRLSMKRITGGFAASATLTKFKYTLTFVATDAAGNRSKAISRTFRVG